MEHENIKGYGISARAIKCVERFINGEKLPIKNNNHLVIDQLSKRQNYYIKGYDILDSFTYEQIDNYLKAHKTEKGLNYER